MIKTYNIRDLSVDEILAREENAVDVSGIVAGVIDNVRKNGDAALAEYTEKFDKVKLIPSSLPVRKSTRRRLPSMKTSCRSSVTRRRTSNTITSARSVRAMP